MRTGCHPERAFAHGMRESESKDLHLFFSELRTHHARASRNPSAPHDLIAVIEHGGLPRRHGALRLVESG